MGELDINFLIPNWKKNLNPTILLTPYNLFPETYNSTEILNNNLKNSLNSSKSTFNPNFTNQITATGTGLGIDYLSGLVSDLLFGDSEVGRNIGTIFSSGLSSTGNTVANNVMKGTTLTQGLGTNAGAALSGAAAGIAGNYIGQGISSLGGDSKLSRGIGAGIATGIGGVGGLVALNLLAGKTAFDSFKGITQAGRSATKAALTAANAAKFASWANIGGLAGSAVGAALSAVNGPSKEYGGKYGNITQIADTAYDAVQMAAGFMGPVGAIVSGGMALNKGLSNLFGSTDGMTTQDAILGSAWAGPVKWLNMWGASTTGDFKNLSWQNTEKTKAFMGNAFGNLLSKFDKAKEEAGKTYGTFSQGAYREALDNLNFANNAWGKILAMTNLNEYLNIRSLKMSSINNQRYAQNIMGGFTPVQVGKLGMKILSLATTVNKGRILSEAVL